jgi:colanic acid/amylovoran biosynthesis protein
MRTKIALINIHSLRNAGDAALCMVTIQQLKECIPDCELTLVMNDPDSYSGGENRTLSFFSWAYQAKSKPIFRLIWLVFITLIPALIQRSLNRPMHQISPEKIRPTFRALLEADIVIGIPGGNIYSYGSGRALLYIAYTMMVAILAGKPLYLLPQSYGPFRYRYEKVLFSWLLSKSRAIMVREPISLKYLCEIGVPESKCQLLPDMAFAFNQPPDRDVELWLNTSGKKPNHDQPALGVSVIDWGAHHKDFIDQSNYEAVIADTLRHFITKYGGLVYLFPQTWGPTEADDDRIPSDRIANLLPDLEDHVFVINQPVPAEMLKAAYGKMDLFIGTRMHANIFALTEFTPVIAIGYQHKTFGTASMVEIPVSYTHLTLPTTPYV